MTKARDLADLLDANGDVKSTNLDNVPASDNASALTTGTLPNARLPANISDGGTEGTKVASGTTAQRGSTTGQWRYNSTTGYFEGKNATGFATLEPTPTVTSVDDGEVDSGAGGNQTIVVTGTNFSSGGTIAFVGSSAEFNATTTTYNSATQVTAVAPKSSFLNAQEPYKVKFTSASGKAGTSGSGIINVDNDPTWSTASGTVVTSAEGLAIPTTQLSATDPDGDAVTYAETTSALSGIGVSLSSSGALTGTLGSVGSDTTTSFTVRATANSKTTDRSFNIVTKNINADALLFDASNLHNPSPAITYSNSNASGVGLVDSSGNAISVNTAVTLTNIHGSSGKFVDGASLANYTYTGSYYGNGTNYTGIGHTIWALATSDPHTAAANHNWFGMHYGNNYSSYNDIWFTYDVGANPSFKLKRITAEATWRSGSSTYTVYGSNVLPNNGSNMNTKGGFSSANLYNLYTNNNPAATFDSGTFSNHAYYRYYVFRMQASGSFDWGWDKTKFYGDYY